MNATKDRTPQSSPEAQSTESQLRATGATTALLRYMTEHSDRPVTIDELQDRFPQWARTQIMNNMTNLVRNANGGIKLSKVQTGVWCYDTKETPKSNNHGPELLLLEVLRHQANGQFWAVNEDGALYKLVPMRPVEG